VVRCGAARGVAADILLTQGDLPLGWARRILGEEVVLGRSTHDLDQARRALEEGWDYLAVGPVHPTPTKPGRPPVGAGLVAQVAALAPSRPWFAIGGIDLGNLDGVLAAGATRVVVVRAITEAADPAAAAATLAFRLTAPQAGRLGRLGGGTAR
jgi:thiamine-phosphate pyrophosphorylase